MNYRNFLLVIFFFYFQTVTLVIFINKEKIIFKKGFSNKGFALVYNQKLFDEGLISKKLMNVAC